MSAQWIRAEEREGMAVERLDIRHKALEERRRNEFLRGLASDFASLRAREATWQHETEERLAWDHTLADDVENE
jgi:hypothetical protein